MKPTAGVIASGVIAILGSLLTVLLGLGMIASWFTMRSAQLPEGVAAPPFNVATFLIVESVILCGFGVFGIVSAIALLRLKKWARVSFLVFGGLLCAFSIMAMIGSAVALFLSPQMIPPEQQPPPGFLTTMFVVFIVFWFALAAMSVWWLVYFTRRKVKELFLSDAEISTPRRGPLSITIIAWLLVVGGGLVIVSFFTSYPVLLFGVVLRGWMAHATLTIFGAVSLVAGVGLLRWRAEAHSLALAVYGFGFLSNVWSLILPGYVPRMQALMQEMSPSNATLPIFTGSFMRFSMILGLIVICVPIWFLITRRRAFLDACVEGEGL